MHRAARWLLLTAVALPVCQGGLCFPDPLGAASFELQNFINNLIFTVVDTVIRNLFNI